MRFVIVATSLIVSSLCGLGNCFGQANEVLNEVDCVDPDDVPGIVSCDDFILDPFGTPCPPACNQALTGTFCDSLQENSITIMSSGTGTNVPDYEQIDTDVEEGVSLVADDVHSCYRTKECRCEVLNGTAVCKEQTAYTIYLLYEYSIADPETVCGNAGIGGP